MTVKTATSAYCRTLPYRLDEEGVSAGMFHNGLAETEKPATAGSAANWGIEFLHVQCVAEQVFKIALLIRKIDLGQSNLTKRTQLNFNCLRALSRSMARQVC
jgi:hypothetical protein